MDERIEKAFEVANYMATLSNQRRLMTEELNQKLIFYKNGATFKITPELITLTKTWIDIGTVKDRVFLDSNNYPVMIEDVQEFFNDITDQYSQALNDYLAKFVELKSKRKVFNIVDL
jgi:hypothetical protein